MFLTSIIYVLQLSFWTSLRVQVVSLLCLLRKPAFKFKIGNICFHVLEKMTDQIFAYIIPFSFLSYFLTLLLRVHRGGSFF